jgi:hypothetical protein
VRSQALFALAWFHAVCQERRNFIPQGWTKFYEFSFADLRAGADIIDRLCAKAGKKFEIVNLFALKISCLDFMLFIFLGNEGIALCFPCQRFSTGNTLEDYNP